MRRCQSGQLEQTVNLPASAYEGSNPSRRTRIRLYPNRSIFWLLPKAKADGQKTFTPYDKIVRRGCAEAKLLCHEHEGSFQLFHELPRPFFFSSKASFSRISLSFFLKYNCLDMSLSRFEQLQVF